LKLLNLEKQYFLFQILAISILLTNLSGYGLSQTVDTAAFVELTVASGSLLISLRVKIEGSQNSVTYIEYLYENVLIADYSLIYFVPVLFKSTLFEL